MRVVVTGPMRSGTNLLTRILAAAPGVEAIHDRSHGMDDRYLGQAHRVVVIVRDPVATEFSRVQFQGRVANRDESLQGIALRAPGALWVTYEHLCAHPEEVIDLLARWLGIGVWPLVEAVQDENSKYWMGMNVT